MLASGFYNMDCMDGMAQFPDKFFGLAIVDPPYGNNLSGGRSANNGWNASIDWGKCNDGWNLEIPNKQYFDELRRVSKNQIVWGGNYFTDNLPPAECWIVWDKGQRDFSLADGEMAWCSFDKAMRIFSFSRATANREPDRFHPTQKPIELYRWLLQHYARPGDKILDTHVGSASSLIACHQLGFEYWGFELDTDYYKAASERLAKAKAQVSMMELAPTIEQTRL